MYWRTNVGHLTRSCIQNIQMHTDATNAAQNLLCKTMSWMTYSILSFFNGTKPATAARWLPRRASTSIWTPRRLSSQELWTRKARHVSQWCPQLSAGDHNGSSWIIMDHLGASPCNPHLPKQTVLDWRYVSSTSPALVMLSTSPFRTWNERVCRNPIAQLMPERMFEYAKLE